MSDVEEFLEHRGVKGMRWGQRKSTGLSNSKSSKPKKIKTPLTKAQKLKRVKRVRSATSLALTAAFLVTMWPKSSNMPVRNLTKTKDQGQHIRSATHKISKTARETLRAQERQKNGAFQVSKMLKDMGADVV